MSTLFSKKLKSFKKFPSCFQKKLDSRRSFLLLDNRTNICCNIDRCYIKSEVLNLNSFIGWIGGKKLLRKEIIRRFPEETPNRYIEVFGGAGWVLFGKEEVSGQLEVFNDINSDLINLYRCIKYHPEALAKELEYVTHSHAFFNGFKSQLFAGGLTDIQRAARFFCVVKMSFCNKQETFAGKSVCLDTTIDRFPKIAKRLKKVVIENRSYEDIIKIYDHPNAFFFLDPPYYNAEKYYKQPFGREDHEKLKLLLDNLKGKFLLTYNDDDFIRELYTNYNIESIDRQNNMSNHSNNKRYAEVIIRNYR